RVEQLEDRVGAERVELLGQLGELVRLAETRLVDGEYVEAFGQHGEVAAEVRPRRSARTATVQHHDRRVGRVAGAVVVQPQARRQLGERAGRLGGQFSYSHAS